MNLYAVNGDELEKVRLNEPCPFAAVIDEYKGWREYVELYKNTGDTKYAAAANDEFRHMLLRLSKALAHVDKLATTDAERTELSNFFNALTA